MATLQTSASGSHGGRSVDITQTGTLTTAVAQVGDVKQTAAATGSGTASGMLFGT